MWVVGVAGLTSGVLNCLTPASAYYNFWLFFIVRILIGFCAVSTLNFKIFSAGILLNSVTKITIYFPLGCYVAKHGASA